jgi:peptidoglycan-associated lipoprotein
MKTKFRIEIAQVMLLVIVAVFASACGKKNVKPPAAAEPVQIGDSAGLETDGELGEREGSLRNKGYISDPGLLAVRFDFDRSELGEEARKVLQANAAALKKRPDAEIQAAGHCDERGTTEYNLALAQRRATAVRNYYKNLGIKMSRMSTISYGEERPACAESTEDCWAQNRRAETLVKTR